MSTISEALRTAKQVDFLVDINLGGTVLRYAGRNLSVPLTAGGAWLYKARLMERPEIAVSYDIRSGSYSVGSVPLTIANRDRIQDFEKSVIIDGSVATIRIWCDGLLWEDIDTAGVLFRGVLSKQYHTAEVYCCTIEDPQYASLKTVPVASIDSVSWPNHEAAGNDNPVTGMMVPVVLGDHSYVSLLCVNTTTQQYAACHGVSKTMDADFDSTETVKKKSDGSTIAHANYTWQQDTDARGNVVSGPNFTTDQTANEPLYCSMRGTVDQDGTITGAAGTLIEHPAEMAYYLLRSLSQLPAAYIDTQSLLAMKSTLADYAFAAYVSESVNVGDLIDRLFSQCSAARVQRRGKIGSMLVLTDGDTVGVVPQFQQVMKTVSISKTPNEMIANDLLVQYAYDPVYGQYRSTSVYNKNNDDGCAQSEVIYGARPRLTVELPDVQDATTAASCAARLISLRAKRHDVVTFEVPYWTGIDYIEGDTALLTVPEGPSLDGTGWTDEPCVLLERQFLSHTIKQTWWRIATD